ncbi:hypothetical protein BKH42_06875 [Helicobacter sp. 13S00482-2]|uniref:phage tail protein n=1 Tax=Helicobacter sp. 13S00482-2 TaxID=1476200 RepID=UPI000BA54BAB|nr:phage tail protein [Helicobacter sp. 13S00482-2]PAF53245.1 hypothetical protein BKH42_06875 [Helicobacter sp. 13S00482-2]
MSLLPSHFKELKIIDEVIGSFLENKLDFKDRFFYKPTPENVNFIANTFDINTTNLDLVKASKLLETPMISKARLGTKEALKEGISKIFGESLIQTAKEDKKLRPFEFSLKTSIDEGINESTLQALKTIVEEIKPVRDNLAGLDFSMPTLKQNISLQTSILWRL